MRNRGLALAAFAVSQIFVASFAATNAWSATSSIKSEISGSTEGTGFQVKSMELLRDSGEIELRFEIAPDFLKNYPKILVNLTEAQVPLGRGKVRLAIRRGKVRARFTAVPNTGNPKEWSVIASTETGWTLDPSCERYKARWELLQGPKDAQVAIHCRRGTEDFPETWTEELPSIHIVSSEIKTVRYYKPGAPIPLDAELKTQNGRKFFLVGVLEPGADHPVELVFDDGSTGKMTFHSEAALPPITRIQLGLVGAANMSSIDPAGFFLLGSAGASIAGFLPIYRGRGEAIARLGGTWNDISIRLGGRYHFGALNADGRTATQTWGAFADLGGLFIFQEARGIALSGVAYPWIGGGVFRSSNRAWRTALALHGGAARLTYPSNGEMLGLFGETVLQVDWIPGGVSRSQWSGRIRYNLGAFVGGVTPIPGMMQAVLLEIAWSLHPWASGTNRWGISL